MFSDAIESLDRAKSEIEFQSMLERALERVSEIPLTELDSRLKSILKNALNLHDVDDLRENLRALKVKAISINTPELSQAVMGWSSSDTIYICSDHRIIKDVLDTIKAGCSVPHAIIIIDSLVYHEGGHCVARRRARECGNDPTLYSTPSSSLNNSTSTSGCPSVIQCGLETGYILETIVLGAVLDPVTLWVSKKKFWWKARFRCTASVAFAAWKGPNQRPCPSLNPRISLLWASRAAEGCGRTGEAA